MSYDLTFLPGSPDSDEPGPLDAAAWDRLLAGARRVLGEVSVHEEPERFFELDHEPTGIQLSLYPGEAAITVPYWYRGAEAARIVDLLYRLARVVEVQTDLTGYDPQVEAGIADAAAHPERAIARFDEMVASGTRAAP
jgi:hypothetical protein